MANSAGICTSFKKEILQGIHALDTTVVRGATTKDSLQAALYLSSGSLAPATKATYGGTVGSVADTSEVTGTGYTAGGIAVTNVAGQVASSGSTGYWTPSGSLVFTTVTIGPTDCCLIFNTTQGNKAVELCTFSAQSPVAATLTLTMPTHAAGTALLNIA